MMGRKHTVRIDEKIKHDSPDNIRSRRRLDRGTEITWEDEDAQPFFVMNNGKVHLGVPTLTHMETLDLWFHPITAKGKGKDSLEAVNKQRERDRRAFINHVLLQGRYWKTTNYFSFWALPRNLFPLALSAIEELADRSMPVKLFVRNREYDVDLDCGVISKAGVREPDSDYREGRLSNLAKSRIDRVWDSEVDKANMNMLVSVFDNKNFYFRRPKAYEAYAIAAARIVDQCHDKGSTLSMDRFYDYIDEKFGGQVSFDDLLDYYHFRLRKKLAGRLNVQRANGVVSGKFAPQGKWIGKLEDYLNQNGIEDTQYQLITDGADVITNNADEAEKVISGADANGYEVSGVRRMNLEGNPAIKFTIKPKITERKMNESKSLNKDSVQYDMFGQPITVKARKSDRGEGDRRRAEARERSEKRKAEKKKQDEKDFYERWRKVGVVQKDLFGND